MSNQSIETQRNRHQRRQSDARQHPHIVVALLSKMFNLAEKWGLRADGTNPCRHVEKYPERKLERYLTHEEFARLGDTLAEAERTRTELPSVVAAMSSLTSLASDRLTDPYKGPIPAGGAILGPKTGKRPSHPLTASPHDAKHSRAPFLHNQDPKPTFATNLRRFELGSPTLDG